MWYIVCMDMQLKELTPEQFAQARKQTMLQGYCDMWLHQEASKQQLYVLHQIELTVKSIEEEDLIEDLREELI